MGPGVLTDLLHGLRFGSHPHVLVGLNKADDAAVFRISDTQALVQTVDFFPPIVDDPYDYGYIAAVNALSDIYAMGAEPAMAMAIAAMPADLPVEIIQQIMQGGIDAIQHAGAVVVGGHTITDTEPKYGLCVTGFVHPDKMAVKSNITEGQCILLSKPLGTGIITTAAKQDRTDAATLRAAVSSMKQLNLMASKTAMAHNVRCMTDVTGFGLIGHLLEMTADTNFTAEIAIQFIPMLPGALDFAAEGVLPGGLRRNREHYEASGLVTVDPSIPSHFMDVLYDPQTSGGLLVTVPSDECHNLIVAGEALGIAYVHIGKFAPGRGVTVIQ
jgi:selenide,water dikinase